MKKKETNINLICISTDGELNALNSLEGRVIYTTPLLSISRIIHVESTDVLNALT